MTHLRILITQGLFEYFARSLFCEKLTQGTYALKSNRRFGTCCQYLHDSEHFTAVLFVLDGRDQPRNVCSGRMLGIGSERICEDVRKSIVSPTKNLSMGAVPPPPGLVR